MSKSASSISSKASSVASSMTSEAAKSSKSASSAAASASASAAGKSTFLATTSTTTIAASTTVIILTIVAATLAALHFSGNLDPLYKWAAQKYFKAAAKAEMVALQKTGSKQAEGYLKEKLKDNPAADLGGGELDEIAEGKVDVGDKLGKVTDAGALGDKLGL